MRLSRQGGSRRLRGAGRALALMMVVGVALGGASEASARSVGRRTAGALAQGASASAGLGVARAALRRVRRVVLDPGHGGVNEGAIGVRRIHEKHLTLALALHLADALRARDPSLEVILTRRSDMDVGLGARAALANEVEADALISLHFNAAHNRDARGYETFWVADTRPSLGGGEASWVGLMDGLAELPARSLARAEAAERAALLAEQVQGALRARRRRGVDRGVKRANFTVLREAQVPAVVVEFGFLTHRREGREMADPARQAELTWAIIDALERYDAALIAREQAGEVVDSLEAGAPGASEIQFTR